MPLIQISTATQKDLPELERFYADFAATDPGRKVLPRPHHEMVAAIALGAVFVARTQCQRDPPRSDRIIGATIGYYGQCGALRYVEYGSSVILPEFRDRAVFKALSTVRVLTHFICNADRAEVQFCRKLIRIGQTPDISHWFGGIYEAWPDPPEDLRQMHLNEGLPENHEIAYLRIPACSFEARAKDFADILINRQATLAFPGPEPVFLFDLKIATDRGALRRILAAADQDTPLIPHAERRLHQSRSSA